MKIGDQIPDIRLPASGGSDVALEDYRGKTLVVYFYPKDNTPGCTTEGQDFSSLYPQFRSAGVEVLGISKDSVRSHDAFIAKFNLAFRLISDTDGVACSAFDVIKEKSMYGRKYRGLERSTFLFDRDGVLQREWRGVKVRNHAAEVLNAARTL